MKIQSVKDDRQTWGFMMGNKILLLRLMFSLIMYV